MYAIFSPLLGGVDGDAIMIRVGPQKSSSLQINRVVVLALEEITCLSSLYFKNNKFSGIRGIKSFANESSSSRWSWPIRTFFS